LKRLIMVPISIWDRSAKSMLNALNIACPIFPLICKETPRLNKVKAIVEYNVLAIMLAGTGSPPGMLVSRKGFIK